MAAFSTMKFQSSIARPLPWSALNRDVARKASVCDSVLTEARRLSEGGNFDGPLNQLVARALPMLSRPPMHQIILASQVSLGLRLSRGRSVDPPTGPRVDCRVKRRWLSAWGERRPGA